MAKTPTIYLAQPIDLNSLSAQRVHSVSEVVRQVADLGAVVYHPKSAFRVGKGVEPNDLIQRVNQYALVMSDALLAFYPEVGSIGVPREIERAATMGMPVLVVTDVADKSFSLADVPTVSTVTTDDLIGLVEDAVVHAANRDDDPVEDVLRIKVDAGAEVPKIQYEGDAGFDLYVQRDTAIGPGEFADVPCGVSMELPEGVWAMVTGRSSTLRKHNLLVTTGIIDTGYRGPLFAGVKNMGSETFYAKEGSRLAQVILLPNLADSTRIERVDELSPSQRGEAGFGSSGN